MHSTAAAIEIRPMTTAADARHARALLYDYVEWIRAAAGFDPLQVQSHLADELEELCARYGRDASVLYLAWDGDVPVGTVAIRCHDDGTAELKRMYVRPVARGRGVARALVHTALATAADLGGRRAWLETLRGVMDPAIALYRAHGFREIASGGRTFAADDLVVMERPLESAFVHAGAAAPMSATAV